MQKLTVLVATAAVLLPALPNQAQAQTGGPLSTIFACQNANNRQGQGAVIGGILGAIAGNQIADNDRTSGTLIGAAVGAAAGSMIGCRMQPQDAQRAQQSTQMALNSGQSQQWTNPQTGASGRVDVVNTYNYGAQPYQQGYNNQQQQQYNARPTLNSIRWTNGVEQPREYQQSEGTYSASGNPPIRSGPSQRARQVGSLRNGETFDGLVRIEGTDWVLASRNGQVLGYIQEGQTRFLGENYNTQYNQPQQQQQYNQASGGYAPYQQGRGQMCRVFDQHFTYTGGQTQTQRFTACQSPNGEWLVQG
jgi:surface antigen